MPKERKIGFVFRGTTKGYLGNEKSKSIPVTCTTSQPAIAILFAMQCANEFPDDAVVYIADFQKIKSQITEPNVLKKDEKEVAFSMQPKEFISQSEGFVSIRDLRKVLEEMNISLPLLVRMDNLTRSCREARRLSSKRIIELVSRLRPLIKK
jgi:hypothetical protein